MPLRVAIIGCGKIADQHVLAMRRAGGCELVALCDRELLMARQLGERFGVEACYEDAARMFEEETLDVVHITTPPLGHYPLAEQAPASGLPCLSRKAVHLDDPRGGASDRTSERARSSPHGRAQPAIHSRDARHAAGYRRRSPGGKGGAPGEPFLVRARGRQLRCPDSGRSKSLGPAAAGTALSQHPQSWRRQAGRVSRRWSPRGGSPRLPKSGVAGDGRRGRDGRTARAHSRPGGNHGLLLLLHPNCGPARIS